jgi:hypothetical protein
LAAASAFEFFVGLGLLGLTGLGLLGFGLGLLGLTGLGLLYAAT